MSHWPDRPQRDYDLGVREITARNERRVTCGPVSDTPRIAPEPADLQVQEFCFAGRVQCSCRGGCQSPEPDVHGVKAASWIVSGRGCLSAGFDTDRRGKELL